MENYNSKDYLQKTTTHLLQLLKDIESAPSVQIQTGQPGTSTTPVATFDLAADESRRRDEADVDKVVPWHACLSCTQPNYCFVCA